MGTESVEKIVELVLRFAVDGKTTTTTGTVIDVEGDSVCVHGDVVNAPEVLDGLHAALQREASRYAVPSMLDTTHRSRYVDAPVRKRQQQCLLSFPQKRSWQLDSVIARSPSTLLRSAQDRLRDEASSARNKDCFASLH